MNDLAERKAALRARMKAPPAPLTAEERRSAGESVANRLLGLEPVTRARTVMAFSSFGSEVNTAPVIRRLFQAGCRVLLPFVREGEMGAAEVRAGQALAMSGYGPDEPPDPVPIDPTEIDVILVPGIAFDRRGHRLGRGGGHYDRYLATLGDHTVRVALCFQAQLLEAVPNGPGDERVEYVVTERETIDCRLSDPIEHPDPAAER